MATSELGVVLALIGATGATVITYILPGAAYYAMHPPGTVLCMYCALYTRLMLLVTCDALLSVQCCWCDWHITLSSYLVILVGTGPAWKRNIALGYVIFGCFIMPFCVTFIFV